MAIPHFHGLKSHLGTMTNICQNWWIVNR